MAELMNRAAFLDPSSLAFRSACNTAVDPTNRPIKRRVITRISQTTETSNVVDHVLDSISDSTIDAYSFAAKLGDNPCWQTLVIEFVSEERQWSDLLKECVSPENIKKLSEWCQSLFDKTFDEKRPGTKTAATLLVTVLGLWIAHGTNKKAFDEITQPIRAMFTGDKLSLPVEFTPSAAGPIGLRLEASNGGDQIPVSLKFDSDKNPIKISFTGEGPGGASPTDVLNDISKQLGDSNASLHAAQLQLTSLAQNPGFSDITATRQAVNALATEVGKTSANLDSINGGIGKLTTEFDTKSDNQFGATKQQSQTIAQQLQVFGHALQRVTVPLTLTEGSSQAVALQSFDSGTGKLSAISLTVSFVRVQGKSKTDAASITIKGEDGQIRVPTAMEEGDSLVIGKIGYKLTVNTLERYWLFSHKLYLSFTPEIAPVPQSSSGGPDMGTE